MTTLHSPQSSGSISTAQPHTTSRSTGLGWLITGFVVLFAAVALLISGAVVRGIDDSWRRDGHLTSHQIPISTTGHAIATQRLDMAEIAPLWPDIGGLLGDVRLRATGSGGKAVFVGVAPADRVAAYLNGVEHATLTELADPATTYAQHPGGAPATRPADQDFWVAQASGTGVQAVQWPRDGGVWTVVVMNADGSAGVDAGVDVGITAPLQEKAGPVLLIGGAVAGLFGIAFILIGAHRRRR